jgi:hypothetical protein
MYYNNIRYVLSNTYIEYQRMDGSKNVQININEKDILYSGYFLRQLISPQQQAQYYDSQKYCAFGAGVPIVIISGSYVGRTGFIGNSGHGFYDVHLDNGFIIKKRGSALKIVDPKKTLENMPDIDAAKILVMMKND